MHYKQENISNIKVLLLISTFDFKDTWLSKSSKRNILGLHAYTPVF